MSFSECKWPTSSQSSHYQRHFWYRFWHFWDELCDSGPYSRKNQNGVVVWKVLYLSMSLRFLCTCIAFSFNDAFGEARMDVPSDELGLGVEVEIEERDLFAASESARDTVCGVTCCVPGCFNNTCEDSRKVSFHKFPENIHQHRLWINRVGRPADWRPTKHSRICRHHFLGLRKSKSHPNQTVFPLRNEKHYGSQ